MMKESLDAAQEVIDALLEKKNLDYSAFKEQIAQDLFDEGIFNGNWDSSVHFDDTNLRGLRAIQEDEYDQHMDDDEDKPSLKSMVVYSTSACAYVWIL